MKKYYDCNNRTLEMIYEDNLSSIVQYNNKIKNESDKNKKLKFEIIQKQIKIKKILKNSSNKISISNNNRDKDKMIQSLNRIILLKDGKINNLNKSLFKEYNEKKKLVDNNNKLKEKIDLLNKKLKKYEWKFL